VVLEPLKEQSSLIAEAAAKEENKRFDTGGATAGDWFARRIRNQRINNRTVSHPCNSSIQGFERYCSGTGDLES
jgi:hypothetical protein